MKYRMIQRCRDGVSHPTDVPVFAGVVQWVLWLGDAAAECARTGERPVAGADSSRCMPTRTASWGARGSGKTCATPGSGVAATGWRA